MVLMIDLDFVMNGTKTTLLQWLRSDLFRYRDLLIPLPSTVTNSTGPGATYLSPAPPAGSGPHRYNFVLFAQPPAFEVPESYAYLNPLVNESARIGFNITDFVARSDLGTAVAGNYMMVANTSTTG